MTVKELKEIINSLPDDYEVRCFNPDAGPRDSETIPLWEIKIVPFRREAILKG